MSAIHKNLHSNFLASDKKNQDSTVKKESALTEMPIAENALTKNLGTETEQSTSASSSSEVLPPHSEEDSTNVVSMDKTRMSHSKLLMRKRKKSRHPLRELRLQRGYTLEELAELTRLSPSYLSRLESGSRRLNTDILNRIAFVLSCHPGDLLPHDAHTNKFIAKSLTPEETGPVALPQDLPLYSLEKTPQGAERLNTQCAEAWIARPPEVFGIARAFAFKTSPDALHMRYSSMEHVFTHPTRPLTLHCQMIAINAYDEAFIGYFRGWTSDEQGHPHALQMTIFEKNETGFQEKEIEIERSNLKASYRIVGSMEAA